MSIADIETRFFEKTWFLNRTTMSIVKVNNLCLEMHGHKILDDISFELQKGDCLELIGATGSGKTMLLEVLATLVKPTSGTVEIGGYDVVRQEKQVKKIIGYVPENFDGYDDLLVQEYLELFASAYRIRRSQRTPLIADSLELGGLLEYRSRYLYELSRGEKQRLCFVKSMLHDPLIILIDAPILWTDFTQQEEFINLIGELVSIEKTIIAASNNPSGMERFCNKFGLLEEGKLVSLGSEHNLVQGWLTHEPKE